MTRKISSDPIIFGPLFWKKFHRASRRAITPELKKKFTTTFYRLINGIPCNLCRNRAQLYVKEHPIEHELTYFENNTDLTMFRYIWTFHNWVNSHLDKPEISWEEALQLNPLIYRHKSSSSSKVKHKKYKKCTDY